MWSKLSFLASPVYFFIIILVVEGLITSTLCDDKMIEIGAVLDLDSRMGKEQKIAMEIAANTFSNDNLQISIQNVYFSQNLLNTSISGSY